MIEHIGNKHAHTNAANGGCQCSADTGYPHTDKGRGIDSQRPRRHLRNGYDIRKFPHAQPVIGQHHLITNHRDDGITATNAEQSDTEKCKEQLQQLHIRTLLLLQ